MLSLVAAGLSLLLAAPAADAAGPAGQGQRAEGDVYIAHNRDTLEALRGRTRIGGSLLVSVAGEVDALSALAELRVVEGDLMIVGNDQLETLKGLGSLERVGGSLWVADNPRLRALDGLVRLEAVGHTLSVSHNPKLLRLAGTPDEGAIPRLRIGSRVKRAVGEEGELRLESNPLVTRTEVDRFVAGCEVGDGQGTISVDGEVYDGT